MALGTRDALLQRADFLIRTRGYAAFSYADLAESTGIRSASVHHHFPKKEGLAATLVANYVVDLRAALDRIIAEHTTAPVQLSAYAKRFSDSFTRGTLPFCAALAAERDALPTTLQHAVSDFFKIHIDWLSQVARKGVEAGTLRPEVQPDRAALLLFSALEGGTLIGWAINDRRPVLSAFNDVLASIVGRAE